MKKNSLNFSGIDTGTIARTLILVLALINQILISRGIAVLPISDDQVNSIVSTLWTVVSAVWAWWKNNSVTNFAQAADKHLSDLRSGAINPDGTKSSQYKYNKNFKR